jgi:hypothetical protein
METRVSVFLFGYIIIPIIVSGSEPTHIMHARTYSFDMFYNKDSTRVIFVKNTFLISNTSLKEPLGEITP